MKLISWNVNGIRACINKGFKEFFKKQTVTFFVFKKQNVKRPNRIRI